MNAPMHENPLCCKNNSDTNMCCADAEEGADTVAVDNPALQHCQKELTEWRDKYMRSLADFDNFKRRSEKERMQWVQSAQLEMIKEMLPIVDDIERAYGHYAAQPQTEDLKTLLHGLAMMVESAHKFLARNNITEITQVTIFDPTLHEAIASVASADKQEGEIVAVLQKGYLFKDQVIRPAHVSVAQ